MAQIDDLQAFALTNFAGLTGPLDPDQVEDLIAHWRPQARFFEEEHFYPVAMAQVIEQVKTVFENLPDQAKDAFRLSRVVRTSGGAGEERQFDPPVLQVRDGAVVVPSPLGPQVTAALRILNDGISIEDALELDDADDDAFLTHGASFDRSDQFFGPLETISGAKKAVPGDPFRPRVEPMTVIGTFRNLLETLKYNVLTALNDDYPPDALRDGFDIGDELFRSSSGFVLPLPSGLRNEIIRDMIVAHEENDSAAFAAALDGLPPGWRLVEEAWDAVTRFAFVEYYFLYPYNDFNRVQTTPFENEHEGDDEGCCVVFERNALNAAAAAGDPAVLRNVTPHSIITSVHEELQGADKFRFLPAGATRDELDLTVWIAWGSHATYLSEGDHDLVDFSGVFNTTVDKLSWLLVLAPPVALVVAILSVIIDHFVDTEDKTSSQGVRTGPPDVVGNHPNAIPSVLQILPTSADRHIYQPEHRDLLRLRSYEGKWGGHDGFFDESPPFAVKTGRYFRRLLKGL